MTPDVQATPSDPLRDAVNLADLETLGRAALDRNALEYYASGANDEHTLRDNRAAFTRARLRPRVLVDVSSVDTGTRDRKSTRLNSSHIPLSRMPSSA